MSSFEADEPDHNNVVEIVDVGIRHFRPRDITLTYNLRTRG